MTETEVVNPIEAALSKNTFDTLEAVKGRAYPQDIIDVHTDGDTALKIIRLEAQINDETDQDKTNDLDAQKAALQEQLAQSRLTFRLRGIAPNVTESIQDAADEKFGEEETAKKARWKNFSYLAANIVSVTNAENKVDESLWTVEKVEALHGWLPESEFDKLFNLMFELTFARDIFDQAVSADF